MQKKFNYIQEGILNSFLQIKNNPRLLLPDLLSIFISIILVALFLQFNDLFSVLTSWGNQQELFLIFKQIFNHTPSLIRLIISFLVVLLINIAIGITLVALRYHLIKQILGKTQVLSFLESYKKATTYTWKLILTSLLVFIIFLIPFTIISLPFFLIVKALPSSSYWIIIPLILLIVLAILVFLVLRLALTYPFAALFLEKKTSPLLCIKQSISFFRNNKKHVFFIFISIFIVQTLLGILFSFGSGILSALSSPFSIIFIYSGIRIIINSILKVWQGLLIFKSY